MPLGDVFPIERSTLYQEVLAMRAEIDRHKWLMSEMAGHDVGWQLASWDWCNRFRSAWLKERREREPI